MACAALFAGTVAPDLNTYSSGTVLQVIVGLNNPSQLPQPINMIGAVQVNTLPNALVLQTTAGTAIGLASDPAVSHVAVNHVMVGSASLGYDYLPRTLQPTAASYTGTAPAGSLGSGVGVAVIDSGIHTSNIDLIGNGLSGKANNLSSRVWYSQSFIPYETTPDDLYGHGTHVAGIIAGNGAESYTLNTPPDSEPQGSVTNADYRGKAPLASIFSLNDSQYSDYQMQTNAAMIGALI